MQKSQTVICHVSERVGFEDVKHILDCSSLRWVVNEYAYTCHNYLISFLWNCRHICLTEILYHHCRILYVFEYVWLSFPTITNGKGKVENARPISEVIQPLCWSNISHFFSCNGYHLPNHPSGLNVAGEPGRIVDRVWLGPNHEVWIGTPCRWLIMFKLRVIID